MATKPLKEMDAYDFVRAIKEVDEGRTHTARVLVRDGAGFYRAVGCVRTDDDGDIVIETVADLA